MQLRSKRRQNGVVLCDYIGVEASGLDRPAEALGRCERGNIMIA